MGWKTYLVDLLQRLGVVDELVVPGEEAGVACCELSLVQEILRRHAREFGDAVLRKEGTVEVKSVH